MNRTTRIIAVLVALAGIALLIYALKGRGEVGAARTFNLNEFGIALEIPGTLSQLSYVPRDESENGPGTVLHMYAGSDCDLGALFEIQKNAIAKSGTTWTEKTLEQFALPTADKPARVKEFTDFYLVFEPNPTLCATDEKEKERETAKQLDLWNALATAHYMQH